jgi:hypothetical protein
MKMWETSASHFSYSRQSDENKPTFNFYHNLLLRLFFLICDVSYAVVGVKAMKLSNYFSAMIFSENSNDLVIFLF